MHRNKISLSLSFPLVALFGMLWGCPQSAPPKTAAKPQESPAEAPSNEPFVDVTRRAGIQYKWEVAGARPLTILQTIGNGVAFLDYDQDGSLDIFLTGPHCALYKGDGKGSFADVSGETGIGSLKGGFLGCAVGDYDNDGFPDLYLTAFQGGALLHNDQGKRWTDASVSAGVKAQPWGSSASFVDIDNDGKLDLYIGNYVVFGPHVKPQLCDFNGKMSSCGPRFYMPQKGVLYKNLGAGKFRDITQETGATSVNGKALGVAAANYDGSGLQSIAIANDEMAGDLLQNRKGKFTNEGASAAVAFDSEGNVHGGMGIDWGDYDNDGKLDLVVATFQREAKNVYHNLGNRLFEERSTQLGVTSVTMPYVAFGVKWFDYDNDGWLDLVFANGHVQDNIADVENAVYRQPTQILHNEQGKRFSDASATLGAIFKKPLVGRGLAIGDYDNDGKLDLLIADSEGEPLLLHNQTPSQAHWLGVRLVGSKSPKDGIGALVTVEAKGRKMVRRCATDGSYMSSSDVRVHFGIGDATTANVTVQWSSGAVTKHANTPIDRYVTLKETP